MRRDVARGALDGQSDSGRYAFSRDGRPATDGGVEGNRVRILIVEQGSSRGALAAVRALAAAGWEVAVGSPAGRGLASSSRHCVRRHTVPAAHIDVAAFLDGVRDAVRTGGYGLVFGAGEAEVLALSEHRGAIPATVPHAAHRHVTRALDKDALDGLAAAVGLAVPRRLDVDTLPPDPVPYVVKAAVHARTGVAGAPPRIDTLRVVGPDAARRRCDDIRAVGGTPQVQEYVHGRLVAYTAVTSADGGRVVGDSMQEASRLWPAGAGASCRARTVAVDDDWAGRCAALLRRLRWFGLAELQFLVPADGRPRLIDLNGRFYGSMALAVAAGANLPHAWAALAAGREVAPVRARPGVRYQWLHGDVRRAVAEPWPQRGRELLTALAGAAGAVHSVGSTRDPRPGLALLGGALRR